MTDWVDRLRDLHGKIPVAMITVLATEGSAPRGAGTRMLVTENGQYGTIGGGKLEHQAAEQARAILSLAPGTWRIQDYPLGPLLGQCCGGRVRLLVEHIDASIGEWLSEAETGHMLLSRLDEDRVARRVADRAATSKPSARGDRPIVGAVFAERIGEYRRPIYLFGAGHVGQAIAAAMAPLPFDLAWYDTREDYSAIAGVVVGMSDELETCIADAPDDAAVLVLTHDHAIDYGLTAQALRSRACFVGLIGSATKRARFLSRLALEGIDAARLTCPIGIAGITGKEPAVIAAATVAQLLRIAPIGMSR